MLVDRHLQGFFMEEVGFRNLSISYRNFRWIWIMFWVMDWVKYAIQSRCETSLLSQGVKKGAKTKEKYE